jgi:hypothetical protein
VIASTSGSAPAESTLISAINKAMWDVKGRKAKAAAVTAQEKTTMPRCAPLASASQPHAAGAKVRASGGRARTQAISTALKPRSAR